MENKRILIKSLRLERCFKDYHEDASQQQVVFQKFEKVWGTLLANHFLSKYKDAESLIWALDAKNLDLFIKEF